jgi:hypothetical protein
MVPAQSVRYQDLHLLADEFVPAVPEQPLGLCIDQRDPAIPPEAHHGVRHRFQQSDESAVIGGLSRGFLSS